MEPAKLLYIDQKGVSLTRFTLKVKDDSFPVKIISYRMVEIAPKKTWGMAAIIFGLLLSTTGLVSASTGTLDLFTVTMYAGFVILMFGLSTFLVSQKKYALQISTALGVKNIIKNTRREYVATIVKALDKAVEINARSAQPGTKAA